MTRRISAEKDDNAGNRDAILALEASKNFMISLGLAAMFVMVAAVFAISAAAGVATVALAIAWYAGAEALRIGRRIQDLRNQGSREGGRE